MSKIKTIGILTSGGDAPGMNAAIRAVTRAGIYNGFKIKGIYRESWGLAPMIASLIYQCVPVPCDSQCSLERNRSVSHATRGRDGRQEGRECGYYHLHRHLNDSLLHTSPPFA